MKSRLRVSKKINRNPNYLAREKRILSLILKILLILIIITIAINLINYINILANQIYI